MPIGVVTLAERHGGVTVTRERSSDDRGGRGLRRRFAAEHGGTDGLHLLGTSGTVTTIAGVYLDLPRYERRRVDGCWLNRHPGDGSWVERLLAMTYEGRVANPCIGAERADLVLAGCAILEAIRRAFPCERLRVADRGPARRHAGADDARGRRLGRYRGARVVTVKEMRAAASASSRSGSRASASRSPPSCGSSASSKIPTVARAKRGGFRSRAAFKLIEIDDKHHVLKGGARVVDLGRRPAAGARWRRKRVGARGRVVGIDILRWTPIAASNSRRSTFSIPMRRTAQGDARRPGRRGAVRHGGQRHRPSPTDHLKIMALVEAAAQFAARC
jgi:exopolyphosphatase/guanosine-5'-triphosphate,3'-diphosphate pyrophosphatase